LQWFPTASHYGAVRVARGASSYHIKAHFTRDIFAHNVVIKRYCNDLIWFDLSVYYDLSSVQIQKALYKFLKSHWFYYDIDYVNKDSFF